ncbi:MAG: tetratricopeptide repeat protein, partial [Deltaproteobacteria bacterium]|nr:tetratricopeptide repeat protein [Deltaproteobacteria bacterium]
MFASLMPAGRSFPAPRTSRLVAAAFVVVLVLATYAGSLGNPFVYDDIIVIGTNALVFDNPDLTSFLHGAVDSGRELAGHLRPLPMLSLVLNYELGGMAPWAFRLVNLVLHLLCGGMLLLVLRRLVLAFPWRKDHPLDPSRANLVAGLATLLFLIHPVNSLSVLLVWKRTTLMVTIPYLLAVHGYCLLRGIGGPPPAGRGRRIGCIVLVYLGYLLALGAKENAVTLPAVLLLLELWSRPAAPPPDRRARLSLALLHAPLWLAVALWLTVLFPHDIAGNVSADWSSYLLTQPKAIWLYLGMLVHPGLLAADYDLRLVQDLGGDPLAILAGAGLLLLVVVALGRSRKAPLAGLACCWLLITISPTSSFVPCTLLVDEDRTYLPFALLWALIGLAGASFVIRRRALALAVSLLVVGGLVFATVARGAIWSDPLWVWLDALEKYPGARNARLALCTTLSQADGQAVEAVAACRAFLVESPQNPMALSSLALALVKLGRTEEAEVEVARGLAHAPQSPELCRIAGHLAWFGDQPARA